MGEIVFVRHGQASFGTDDYDRLSDLGWQQARWLGQHLAASGRRFSVTASGDQRRHVETASAISEAVPVESRVVAPGLNEMNFDVLLEDAETAGVIEPDIGDDSEVFAREFPKIMRGWQDGSFPTRHESFDAFEQRILGAVTELAVEGRDVLIVSSGGPKAMLMRQVLELGTEKTSEVLLGIHNSSFSRFVIRDGVLRLAEFNAIPHLSTPDRAHARTYI